MQPAQPEWKENLRTKIFLLTIIGVLCGLIVNSIERNPTQHETPTETPQHATTQQQEATAGDNHIQIQTMGVTGLPGSDAYLKPVVQKIQTLSDDDSERAPVATMKDTGEYDVVLQECGALYLAVGTDPNQAGRIIGVPPGSLSDVIKSATTFKLRTSALFKAAVITTSALKDHATAAKLPNGEKVFDVVRVTDEEKHWTRPWVMQHSPFTCTLYLDGSTCVCGNLTRTFQILKRIDIAMAYSPLRSEQLAIQKDKSIPVAFAPFSSSVFLFRTTPQVVQLFDSWESLVSAAREQHGPRAIDQLPLRRALWEFMSNITVHVLPPEYNFQQLHKAPEPIPRGVLFILNRLNQQCDPTLKCTLKRTKPLTAKDDDQPDGAATKQEEQVEEEIEVYNEATDNVDAKQLKEEGEAAEREYEEEEKRNSADEGGEAVDEMRPADGEEEEKEVMEV